MRQVAEQRTAERLSSSNRVLNRLEALIVLPDLGSHNEFADLRYLDYAVDMWEAVYYLLLHMRSNTVQALLCLTFSTSAGYLQSLELVVELPYLACTDSKAGVTTR